MRYIHTFNSTWQGKTTMLENYKKPIEQDTQNTIFGLSCWGLNRIVLI
jgi:hypothetical protein